MPKTTLNIDVLGCSIPISAEEEEQYLSRLLDIYKIKISEMKTATGLSDPLKIAILTGFMLCDEGEKFRLEKTLPGGQKTNPGSQGGLLSNASNVLEHNEAEKLTLSLITRLEDILGPDNAGTASTGNDPKIENMAHNVPDKQWIYKLLNTVKTYEWGSPEWIPDLLGESNEKHIPWAEVWMGVHPEGPSKVVIQNEETAAENLIKLDELINKDLDAFLGEERAQVINGLPFLFKILAAEKPLSIQAHPNLAQAKQGWEKENEKDIPINAVERNYKDPNHKPEIICALRPFTAMAGFRKPREIKALLELFMEKAPQFLLNSLRPLIIALEEENPLRSFLKELFSLSPFVREALSEYAREQESRLNLHEKITDYPDEWKLIAQFAKFFPADPAILSPIYLNLIHLNPGEAIYLPAGILHAYIYGLGVELMANSDNVLRGGLTSKHIDIPELLRILDFSPYKPDILKVDGSTTGEYEYPVPCKEFSLSVIQGGEQVYLETGPSIILVTEGELTVNNGSSEIILKQGESAFIPAGNSGLKFSGAYTVYAAGTGPVQDTVTAETEQGWV